ncbi:hypothetical protein C8J57DRAFT_1368668 [Mycena rebaudengoi]|nr:hypothetical protein C8J57DRAFT_1368668 [Mycena rebaudengoi]
MPPLDDEAVSMAFPWSSKTIRSRRKTLSTFCCGCGQREGDLARPLRYCSKCQVASYCSKECQKSDWPEHKPICGAAGIPKLIKTLMANPDLLMPLGGCFILAFDLINRARCSEPLVARLDVAVNAFTPIINPKRITDCHRVVWQREFARADASGFHANEELVAEWITDGFAKPTDADPTGKTTRDPCTIHTSIQILNAYIKADKKNKMLLRAQMRPADIQVIRKAATDPETVPAIMLLTKIAREPIYRPMYQVFVEGRKAATGVAPSIPALNLL